MNLTPTEIDRLILFNAAEFARRHQKLGIRLSHPEAVALIADEMLLAARRNMLYADIVEMACGLLTTDDVEPGVGAMIDHIAVEGNFEEGTKLIVVFAPIGAGSQVVAGPVPGEIMTPDEDIELNVGRARCSIKVVNTGDRDIQVRSHAHFFEANPALEFDRRSAFGMRLDKPSGVGVRFEPGLSKVVELVALGGSRAVFGQAGLVEGPLDTADAADRAVEAARQKGYRGC